MTEPRGEPPTAPHSPNFGVVRGRTGRGATLAALLAGGLTIVAVVLLAIGVQGGF
jgi:hypothetical protein